MSRLACLLLAVALLAACGIKGDPAPPQPEAPPEAEAR
ncbi:lipoprotein [uncultured Amaricoccus sp.]|nr:lipoprotein [uncultured Amaricoccus sp.]